ncbi:MAG: urease accessory protein [Thermoleophilaceae bacterium]|nr:urease accessory protein [Thermoleophilaceae bacterium]
MTLRVTELLGHAEEPRFAGRRVAGVPVAWDEASRQRLRRQADDGTDVAIDLEHGAYLADGAVLHDDGERIVKVSRPRERALVVRFDAGLPADRLVAQALLLGHAFGNQHVPIDIEEGEARIPLTTSEAIARATVEALDLSGVTVEVAEVAIGRMRPLPIGHAHRHSEAGPEAEAH